MNTRLVMASSAITLALLGVAGSFLPQEILAALHQPAAGPLPLVVQLLAALYLAFGMLNWTAKDSLIGGIYNRPVALGNLVHFMVGALALAKGVTAGQRDTVIVALAVFYVLFAIGFAAVFFTSPVKGAAS
jgi:Fe2+ transport system protein B